jgi:hypothetical protein
LGASGIVNAPMCAPRKPAMLAGFVSGEAMHADRGQSADHCAGH